MHNTLLIPLAEIPSVPCFSMMPPGDVFIVITAIILGCAIPLFAIYTEYRKRKDIFEMHHRERMAAIEQGIPVPPLPEGLFDDSRGRNCSPASALLKGLVWLFLGISSSIAVWVIHGNNKALFGLMPASIGAAYLIFYAVEGRKTKPVNAEPPKLPNP